MFDETNLREKLDGALSHFDDEMKKIRTGRAHTDMLSTIKAEVYGTPTPLNQIANVSVTDASLLTVTPYDPNNLSAIISAIRDDKSLGLNPADDGRIIRIPVPPLTEERRKDIAKIANIKAEEAKVTTRGIREDIRKGLLSDKLPEDAEKRGLERIDDITKEFSRKVDAALSTKQKEIMTL